MSLRFNQFQSVVDWGGRGIDEREVCWVIGLGSRIFASFVSRVSQCSYY